MSINHTWGRGRPHWFETMVFRQMDTKRMLGRQIDQWRYATLEEARSGHKLAALGLAQFSAQRIAKEASYR